jgi:Terminase large subunit, T4likevirus-type, N-terminal
MRTSAPALERRINALAVRVRPPAVSMPTALELAARAGFAPDPWQAAVLTSRAQRILLNCSRQSGKSSVTALVAVHTALSHPGSLILLVSPTLRQSGELFRSARRAYGDAGGPDIVPPLNESALTLSLRNGSRIVCLPGKEGTVRGYAGVTLLAIDEAARVPDDLYFALRPMLAVSGGRLLALSTPFGTRGWWYESWVGREAWERVEVPASMCPRISPAFLAEEKRAIGDWWYEQEYQCQFLDAESAAFARADIDAAFDLDVQTWAV